MWLGRGTLISEISISYIEWSQMVFLSNLTHLYHRKLFLRKANAQQSMGAFLLLEFCIRIFGSTLWLAWRYLPVFWYHIFSNHNLDAKMRIRNSSKRNAPSVHDHPLVSQCIDFPIVHCIFLCGFGSRRGKKTWGKWVTDYHRGASATLVSCWYYNNIH